MGCRRRSRASASHPPLVSSAKSALVMLPEATVTCLLFGRYPLASSGAAAPRRRAARVGSWLGPSESRRVRGMAPGARLPRTMREGEARLSDGQKQIAIVLYDRFTALDAVGPYEVLSRLPSSSVVFVAERPGEVRTDTGTLALTADAALEDVPAPDVVVVPGGPGQADLMEHEPLMRWLRRAHQTTTWTTSVCTGSLLLGAAGILRGVRATSHWLALDQIAGLGGVPVQERVVVDGKIVTAAGVSAGIDMGIRLAALEAGEDLAKAIQLGIEYDPEPPFAAGSPSVAPPEIVKLLRDASRFVLRGPPGRGP